MKLEVIIEDEKINSNEILEIKGIKDMVGKCYMHLKKIKKRS